MPKKKYQIDTQWFLDRLAELGLSQRTVATRMRMDINSFTGRLKGVWKIDIPREGKQLAEILEVSLNELLKHVGVESDEKVFPVVGYIDRKAIVHMYPKKPVDQVVGPLDLPPATVALACKTALGSLEVIDGWTLFVELTGRVAKDTAGRLCIVKPAGEDPLLSYVKRSGKARAYHLHDLFSSERQFENMQLEWSAPILWIRL